MNMLWKGCKISAVPAWCLQVLVEMFYLTKIVSFSKYYQRMQQSLQVLVLLQLFHSIQRLKYHHTWAVVGFFWTSCTSYRKILLQTHQKWSLLFVLNIINTFILSNIDISHVNCMVSTCTLYIDATWIICERVTCTCYPSRVVEHILPLLA